MVSWLSSLRGELILYECIYIQEDFFIGPRWTPARRFRACVTESLNYLRQICPLFSLGSNEEAYLDDPSKLFRSTLLLYLLLLHHVFLVLLKPGRVKRNLSKTKEISFLLRWQPFKVHFTETKWIFTPYARKLKAVIILQFLEISTRVK